MGPSSAPYPESSAKTKEIIWKIRNGMVEERPNRRRNPGEIDATGRRDAERKE
jgi:hypothetical protein